MNKDLVVEILTGLEYIKSKLDAGMVDEDDRHRALCSHMYLYFVRSGKAHMSREAQELLAWSAKSWANYSGDTVCHVPAPDSVLSSLEYMESSGTIVNAENTAEAIYEAVFHGLMYGGNYWDQTTEYGRLRADLLQHHINNFHWALDQMSEV